MFRRGDRGGRGGDGPGANIYQMKQKMHGDRRRLLDRERRRPARVQGGREGAPDPQDACTSRTLPGNDRYLIKEKLVSVRDVMTIETDAGPVATVKKALISPLRERYDVELAAGGSWKVQGNIVDHAYEIEGPAGKIAEVGKKLVPRPRHVRRPGRPGPGRRPRACRDDRRRLDVARDEVTAPAPRAAKDAPTRPRGVWVAASEPSAAGSSASAGTPATRAGVRAHSVAVRLPSSSAARSPTTAPGPISATCVVVDLDDEDPVEDQEDVRARLALADEGLALGDASGSRLGAAAHDRARERALERRLDRGDDGRRVLRRPTASGRRTSG